MTSYKRLLLKISGEALMGKLPFGIDEEAKRTLAKKLALLHSKGHEIGIVIGGGNFFRGLTQGKELTLERINADQIGMLATLMNGIALKDALLKEGVSTRHISSIDCPLVAEKFQAERALKKISKKEIVIFTGGTGHPFFTTDTAAALRALEIKADILLKCTTRVDGIYTADPLKDPKATKYDTLSYKEYVEKKLGALDLTAVTLCMSNGLPIRLFNLYKSDLEEAATIGSKLGTLIS